VNEVVASQLTFPNEKGCQFMIVSAKKENNAESIFLLKLMSCSNTSASQNLPYRATIRNKVYGFLIDVEVITLKECEAFIGSFMESSKEDLEIVSACKEK